MIFSRLFTALSFIGLALEFALFIPPKSLAYQFNVRRTAPAAVGVATLQPINQATPSSKILGQTVDEIFSDHFNSQEKNLLFLDRTVPGLPLNSINEHANSFNFAALLENGSFVIWNIYNLNAPLFPPISYATKIVSVTSNASSFSMLFDDGSVGFWNLTGDAVMVQPSLPKDTKATSIFSNETAFVALLDNGKIFCWGDLDNGGTTPVILSKKKVESIVANDNAFVAILNDGSIQCWGDPTSGGLIPSSLKGKAISNVVPSAYAFTALLKDGSLESWGDPFLGGELPTSLPKNKDIDLITANVGAFAVLFKDGTLQCWGDKASGGETPIINNGSKVLSILRNGYAFTALLDGGTLQSWGDASYGGIAPYNLREVVSCIPSFYSFTAILTNHVAWYWGLHAEKGKMVVLPADKEIVSVVASGNAFTALFEDGTVQSWGDDCSGGRTPNLRGRKVKSLMSSFQGFIVLLDNGSLHTWGGRVGSLGEVYLFDQELNIAPEKSTVALTSPLNKMSCYQSDRLEGIAVVENPSLSDGKWEYLESGTTNWQTIPSVSRDEGAFLIKANDKLRFVPTKGFYGNVHPIKVRLIGLGLDLPTGSYVDVSLHGDGTFYSDQVISLLTRVEQESWLQWLSSFF